MPSEGLPLVGNPCCNQSESNNHLSSLTACIVFLEAVLASAIENMNRTEALLLGHQASCTNASEEQTTVLESQRPVETIATGDFH
jgi:hypothetical protein